MLVAFFVCLSSLLLAGCSTPEASPTSPAVDSGEPSTETSQEETDATTVESSDQEETKYTVTYSALGRRLRSNILRGSLEKLWKQYTVRTGGYIEIHVGTGGNVYAFKKLPVNDVLVAESLVEDAVSLLIDGKLPTETHAKPIEPDKVMGILGEAYDLLEAFRSASFQEEAQFTEWIQAQEHSDVATEGTVQQIVEEFDFIRECVSKTADVISEVSEELPLAVEG